MLKRLKKVKIALHAKVILTVIERLVNVRLKQDRWQKDGQNFSKVYIVANTVQLLGGKSDGEQTHTSSAPKSAHNTNQSDDGGFPEDNSDIPF